MKSLTVAELRRRLDQLDPPPDAEVVFRSHADPFRRMFATPIMSVMMVHLLGEKRLVELTTDIPASWD